MPESNPTFQNPAWHKAAAHILIARLSPFRDVDRSTPHLFLFQEIRHALPQAYIDLTFFPNKAERVDKGSFFRGLQSGKAGREFDLILISNAYVLELINLAFILMQAGIPLYTSERDAGWPVLVLGGSNAMASQALLIRPDDKEQGIPTDGLVDGVFFGEGEGLVGSMVRAVIESPRDRRREALAGWAAGHEGLWVVGSGQRVRKAVFDLYRLDLEQDSSLSGREPLPTACLATNHRKKDSPAPTTSLQPQTSPGGKSFLLTEAPLLDSPEAHTASLQINFGCPAFCSFCFEGYERKPYREINKATLVETARQIKRAQGCEDLNLASFNLNTHGEILALIPDIYALFDRISLKSQRIDLLQNNPALLEAQIVAGKRSFTLGIEGISDRLRAWLHKSLSRIEIVELLATLIERRVREIKLFYILTGGETDEDMAEFRQFLHQVKTMPRSKRGTRLIFSFGLLMRMPFTPLRYNRLCLDPGEWKPLIGQVKSACETNGFEFRVAFEWADYAMGQVMALGGYWLCDILVELAHKGYFLDRTLDAAYWDEFEALARQRGHLNESFLGEKPPEYDFALDFVETDIADKFLYRQYKACLAGVDEGYCLGQACLGCGACRTEEERESNTEHSFGQDPRGSTHMHRDPETLSRLKGLVEKKRRLKPLYTRLRVPPWMTIQGARSANPAFLNAAVFRSLLAQYPDQVENLLSVRESLFTIGDNAAAFPVMSGEGIFALKAWDVEALPFDHTLLELNDKKRELSVEVLGIETEFVPGVWSELELKISLPLTLEAGRKRLEGYLRDSYMPYSLRRDGERRFEIDVPKKGKKKKCVLAGWFGLATVNVALTENISDPCLATGIDNGTDCFVAHLRVGKRFNLNALIKRVRPLDLSVAHIYLP